MDLGVQTRIFQGSTVDSATYEFLTTSVVFCSDQSPLASKAFPGVALHIESRTTITCEPSYFHMYLHIKWMTWLPGSLRQQLTESLSQLGITPDILIARYSMLPPSSPF